MARFHQLRVAAVDRLTDDSVALTLEVPETLREEFRHAPGQHLALRRPADDGEIRRTYSICSPAPGPEGPRTLRVGVRLVEGGSFSTYALKEIAVGDALEVMTPASTASSSNPPRGSTPRWSAAAASPRSCRSRPPCSPANRTPASASSAATAPPRPRCSWTRWPT